MDEIFQELLSVLFGDLILDTLVEQVESCRGDREKLVLFLREIDNTRQGDIQTKIKLRHRLETLAETRTIQRNGELVYGRLGLYIRGITPNELLVHGSVYGWSDNSVYVLLQHKLKCCMVVKFEDIYFFTMRTNKKYLID